MHKARTGSCISLIIHLTVTNTASIANKSRLLTAAYNDSGVPYRTATQPCLIGGYRYRLSSLPVVLRKATIAAVSSFYSRELAKLATTFYERGY
jgi:hypothetical protein